jgi:hypothetical protein
MAVDHSNGKLRASLSWTLQGNSVPDDEQDNVRVCVLVCIARKAKAMGIRTPN